MDEIKKYSVLIVDDESMNLSMLTYILGSDYTVYAEKNGQGAIEAAEKLLPNVILLDIIMPGMDGHDVIKALKSSEKTKDIPVIFVSGISEADAEEESLEWGAADYISKPFSPEIVKRKVDKQIECLSACPRQTKKAAVEAVPDTPICAQTNVPKQ